MFTTRSFLHILSILFMAVSMLAGLSAGQVVAAPLAEGVKPPLPEQAASSAPTGLLQFTAGGHVLGFTAEGMYAATGSHALHVDFVGANSVQPQADSPASSTTLGYSLLSQDNASFGTKAVGKTASLSRVTYMNLWNGISLTYTAEVGSIYTTSYSLAPGANPADIRLLYNAPLRLNKAGSLGITFETGTMTESAPLAWQAINGQRVPVEVSFKIHGQAVGFALGTYDPHYALTIDPSVIWNTFLGGGAIDFGTGIAVDGSGNVYVTGRSDAFWGSPVRAYTSGYDVFVAKLDSSGGLTWNTFLGGSGDDIGYGIAVDASGNVYVTGYSTATWGSPVSAYSAGADAFAAKLDSEGNLTWNTFLGGSAGDHGYGIAEDTGGNVYVTGYSTATWGSPLRAYSGADDAFAAKLNAYGGLTWNTFLGGSAGDYGTGIAFGFGNVYVTGYSNAAWSCSPASCTVRPYTGVHDAFAAKLDSSGGLTWNTFLGGSAGDYGYGIAVDTGGNVYVTGVSNASWGTPVRAFAGYADAFAAKLTASGALTWHTFLGGSGEDEGLGIAVDGSGNVYVTGNSDATWGSPVRPITGIGADAFAASLNASGGLTLNTFLGESSDDYGYGIAVDGSGGVYVTGESDATWGIPVRNFGGGYDAFAARVDLTPPGVVSSLRASPNPINAASVNYTVTFSEAVTGVDTSDFSLNTSGVSGTSVSGVSGSGSTYTVTVNTGVGSGTLRLDLIDNDTILDAAGNPLGGSGAENGNYTAGQTYSIDKIAPTVLSSLRASPNPTGAQFVHFTVTFSEPVTGLDISDFSLLVKGISEASVTAVSCGESCTNVYTVTVNTGTGNGMLRLAVTDDDSILDLAGNPLGGAGAGNGDYKAGQSYEIDKTLPTVLSSLRASSNPTNTSSVNYTVSFSEAVTGVDAGDFPLNTSGVSGTSVTTVSGSGSTYTVTVNTGTGDGTLRLDVSDNDSILDLAGNPLGGPGAGNGSYTGGQTYTIDKTAPTVLSSDRTDTSPNSSLNVDFSMTFSEAVTGVDTSDFSLNTSGVSGTSVTTVSGSGSTYTVSVNTGTGDGTLRLDVSDNDSILDLAGNPLGGAGAGNGNYTDGQTYSIDKTAPDTQIDSHPANPSNSANASFTFSSSDVTATFECSLEGGAYAACTSPKNYTGLADSSHTFAVRARDPAGNVDASPASFTWTIDTTAPDTQIDSHPANPSNSANASFTFSSSDITATFECSLEGGAYAACTSPKDYTGLADGSHTFAVRSRDPAGNVDASPASYTWTIDTIPPAAPTNVQASDGTYTTKVLVSWTASIGATSYKVYRAASAAGTKSLLGSPTGTTFNDTSATPGVTYRYWVVAYRGTRYSAYSAPNSGWRKLSPPTNLQASDGTYTTKVLVSWNASSGATSYKVFRATSAIGTKTLLGSPTGITFNDTSATPGVTFRYWVVAYRGTSYSGYSVSDTGWRKLSPPTNVQASDGTYTNKVLVSWTASSGATSYKVYRATSAAGTKTLLGSPTGTTFNDTSATPGVTYYYWVVAYRSTRYSGYSAPNSGWRKK